MDDVGDRLDAIEWMIARWLAETRDMPTLRLELDDAIPASQYKLGPARNRLFPHFERMLQRAMDLKQAAGHDES